MVSGKCGAAWLSLELVPNTRQSRRSQASARQNGRLYFDAPMTHCSSHRRLLQQNLPIAVLSRRSKRRANARLEQIPLEFSHNRHA